MKMKKNNSTKKALVLALLSTLLCVSMLIGTTFAWFTDTASTAVNKIVAGNLKVGFQYWNGEKYVDVTNVSLFSEDIRWEPGHTEVVYLKVVNQGNLALKYRLNTINTFEYQYAKNSNGKQILLSDFLKIGIAEGKNAAEGVYETREEAIAAVADNSVSYDSYTKDSTLLPAEGGNESADYLAFVVYMPAEVGNEANAVDSSRTPWIRFNLALNAIQASYESDSFGNEYDQDVVYPIGSTDAGLAGETIQNLLNKATDYIVLGSNAKRPAGYGFHVNSPATINLNGFTMTSGGSQSTLNISGRGKLTVIGNGTVDASNVSNDSNAVRVTSGGTVVIEGGTYIGKAGNSCIYNAGGTVEIKGGTFMIADDTDANAPRWTLNCQDGSGSVITVTGGTFYKFDPSNANTGAGEIVVPAGYKVVQNGDWYTVVEDITTVNSNEEFNTALSNAKAGSKIILNCDVTELTVAIDAIPSGIIVDGQNNKYGLGREVYYALAGLGSVEFQNVAFLG